MKSVNILVSSGAKRFGEKFRNCRGANQNFLAVQTTPHLERVYPVRVYKQISRAKLLLLRNYIGTFIQAINC